MAAPASTGSTAFNRFHIPAVYVRAARLTVFALVCVALALYVLAFLPRLYFLLLSIPEPRPPLSLPGILVVVLAEYAVIVTGTVIGLFLFFRRQDDVVTLLTMLGLIICLGNTTALWVYPALMQPALKIPGAFVFLTITPISYAWLLSFPDGRLGDRRFLWMMLPSILWDMLRLLTIYPTTFAEMLATEPLRAAGNGIAVVLLIPGVIGQIQRYRHQSTPTQKQQTKWMMLGLVVALFGVIGSSVLRAVCRQSGDPSLTLAGEVFAAVISSAAMIGGNFALMFGVLRRGLWDIDLTVNRSLVAAFVTGLLGVVFVVIFALVQAGLRGMLSAGQGEIAVATAALGVGLLFNPVRIQARRFVDRRLYGLRFDLNQLERGQQAALLRNPGALTGQVIGGYRLMGVLGRGAMGEVYRGYIPDGKPAAVKILRSELVSDTQIRQRFEREGAVALNHPGIVQTYHYGESDGTYYIVMEYVEGHTLKEVLHERKILSMDDITPFIHPFAAALDTAHAQGYVHRDIKPGNIMLRNLTGEKQALLHNPAPVPGQQGNRSAAPNEPLSQGAAGRGELPVIEAVLMDFGIAKMMDGTSSLTGSNAVGTVDYMAPEQIATSHAVDYHADIYALGVVMYEMLTGERPYKGSPAQVMFGHLQQPPPDPRRVVDHIPDTAALAILRAMSKNPEDRFDSAGAFARSLTETVQSTC